MKLWNNSKEPLSDLNKLIEKFTIGNDPQWDMYLAEADLKGTLAHAEMLCKQNLLSENDLNDLRKGITEIRTMIENNEFRIEEGIEDVHSQIEFLLTDRIGAAGKKVHSARSRNDQSLLDIKLFIKEELSGISVLMRSLFTTLLSAAEKHKQTEMPGYTHMQVAMPSSFGLWFSAYAESLCDDLELLLAAYRVADKNPLGSGAGYGSSFPIDRSETTKLLGFRTMNVNSVYAQMSRGKTEKICSMALASVAATLSKLSYDVCLFSSQNFGFFILPDVLSTGSSIMPHKKNPDVFELIRAKCNRIQSLPNELSMLCMNLPSGYHRDMQLSKECLIPGILSLKECLEICIHSIPLLEVQSDICKDPKYRYMYSVEQINSDVVKGIPFRDAYRKTQADIENGTYKNGLPLQHTHEGSKDNLCLDQIRIAFEELYQKLN